MNKLQTYSFWGHAALNLDFLSTLFEIKNGLTLFWCFSSTFQINQLKSSLLKSVPFSSLVSTSVWSQINQPAGNKICLKLMPGEEAGTSRTQTSTSTLNFSRHHPGGRHMRMWMTESKLCHFQLFSFWSLYAAVMSQLTWNIELPWTFPLGFFLFSSSVCVCFFPAVLVMLKLEGRQLLPLTNHRWHPHKYLPPLASCKFLELELVPPSLCEQQAERNQNQGGKVQLRLAAFLQSKTPHEWQTKSRKAGEDARNSSV